MSNSNCDTKPRTIFQQSETVLQTYHEFLPTTFLQLEPVHGDWGWWSPGARSTIPDAKDRSPATAGTVLRFAPNKQCYSVKKFLRSFFQKATVPLSTKTLHKSPRCLTNTRDFALVGQLTEADTADTVLAEVGVGAAADLAAVVLTSGELLLLLLLEDHRCFSHCYSPSYYLAKGAPMRVSISLASASVLAVVTKQMSIPRILSTLSYSISGKISCSFRPRA